MAGPAGFICFQEPLMLDQQLTRTNCTDVMTSANRLVAPDSENVARNRADRIVHRSSTGPPVAAAIRGSRGPKVRFGSGSIETGRSIKSILRQGQFFAPSNPTAFVTGVTWVDGELWHANGTVPFEVIRYRTLRSRRIPTILIGSSGAGRHCFREVPRRNRAAFRLDPIPTR